jgi:hypothetical protein
VDDGKYENEKHAGKKRWKDTKILGIKSWWSKAMNGEEWRQTFKEGQDLYRVVESVMMMMMMMVMTTTTNEFVRY